MESFKSNEEKIESKFNAGLAKLERIHHIRMGLHLARLEHNPHKIFSILRCFRLELHDRMKEKDILLADQYEMNIVLAQKGQMLTNPFTGCHQISYNLLFLGLYEYEMFLTKLEAEYGLGMPDKPHAADSISEME